MGHLEIGEVAAYVDRVLPSVERDRVEAHLAECAECRQEAIEVSRLRHTRSRRSRWLIFAPLAAAAAVVLVLVARTPDTRPETVFRDGGQPGVSVALVAPAESAVVEQRPVVFTWRTAGAAASYRLNLADERGDLLWTWTSSDTTARLPDDVSLRAGQSYFWYVDALLSDGGSVASGVQRFTTRR